MVVPALQQVASPPDQIEAEAVAALFFPEDRPLAGAAGLLDWRLNGLLTNLIRDGKVSGQFGEQLWLQANGKLRAPWVLLAGGGERQALADADKFRQIMTHLLQVAAASGIRRLVVGVDPDGQLGKEIHAGLIEEVWTHLAPEAMQCLVSFDQSWVKR